MIWKQYDDLNIHLILQDVEEQTFPTGDEDLLNVDELVAQVGSDDNRGQDVATDRENITSTPTKDAPREPANISPIPSTSKKVTKILFFPLSSSKK